MKQSEKKDVILKYLYQRRDDGKEYSIKEILESLNVGTSTIEVARLASQLASDKFIDLKDLSTNLKKARITAQGIGYCEGDSYGSKGESIVQNIHITGSPQANVVVNSSRITITQDQHQKAEGIIKEIRKILIEDEAVLVEQKAEILECLTEIESGISNNKFPKFALKGFLTMTSEVASIASLGLSLVDAFIKTGQ